MGIKRGDIVWANLDGAIGSEQGKDRVCVVMQNDIGNKYSPTTIVVPLTSQLKKINQPTHVLVEKINATGLKKDSMAECEQLRVIDKQRIKQNVGKILNEEMLESIFNACVIGLAKLTIGGGVDGQV